MNRDSGLGIPEAWMATIKQHNSRSLPQRTYEGTDSQNPPTTVRIEMHQSETTTMLQIVLHN